MGYPLKVIIQQQTNANYPLTHEVLKKIFSGVEETLSQQISFLNY